MKKKTEYQIDSLMARLDKREAKPRAKVQIFEEALFDFDRLDIGGYDALNHTSVKDLFFLVLHELDLLEEGEENDFKKPSQIRMARYFLKKWGK